MTTGTGEGGTRLPSTAEERYHAVVRYLAQLLWAAGAADEAITVLSALLAKVSDQPREAAPDDRSG
ncbi:hypothetical protein HC031_17430 [Planosporangium thailandense]|uniref:Tetratricopeptide repeat protein n=1 Tax=Planosporangium thailandense TaxID=765197 RepID=A0ABX0Y092_9ACTN|nr:hypothetical protein [Planosporangium thailandense]NJC71486.1 hypothetical protein [Planosporangium thailandense]